MLPSRQPKANPNIPKRTEAERATQDISNLEAKDRRGGGAHGPPRNPQGSISRVLGTEETRGLPRLGNRPQDSNRLQGLKGDCYPKGFGPDAWPAYSEHKPSSRLYIIQRERNRERTQPHTQDKRKGAEYIVQRVSGPFTGGDHAEVVGPISSPGNLLANSRATSEFAFAFAAASLRPRCTWAPPDLCLPRCVFRDCPCIW